MALKNASPTVWIFCLTSIVCAGQVCAAETESEPVNFQRDIKPLLSDRCFACHGPDETSRVTEVRFDQRASALEAESDSGL